MQLVNESRYLDAIYASGLFDEYWYRHVYDEVDFSTIHPMEHYLTKGWREGKEPSPIFSTKVFQHYCNSPDIGEVCPLLIYLTFGIEENLPYNERCLTSAGGASKKYD